MENSVIKKLAGQGLQHQLDQTQEECAELIAVISKFRRRNGDTSVRDLLIEEVADVTIMLKQLHIMLGSKDIENKINEKLARSKERLENGTI